MYAFLAARSIYIRRRSERRNETLELPLPSFVICSRHRLKKISLPCVSSVPHKWTADVFRSEEYISVYPSPPTPFSSLGRTFGTSAERTVSTSNPVFLGLRNGRDRLCRGTAESIPRATRTDRVEFVPPSNHFPSTPRLSLIPACDTSCESTVMTSFSPSRLLALSLVALSVDSEPETPDYNLGFECSPPLFRRKSP